MPHLRSIRIVRRIALIACLVFVFPEFNAFSDILHLELGAANYRPDDGNDPKRFHVLDLTMENLVHEYGAKGVIYLNDLDRAGLDLAVAHAKGWLSARGYTEITVKPLYNSYKEIELPEVDTMHLTNPNSEQLSFQANLDHLSSWEREINERIGRDLERVSSHSKTGMLITTYFYQSPGNYLANVEENIKESSSIFPVASGRYPYYLADGSTARQLKTETVNDDRVVSFRLISNNDQWWNWWEKFPSLAKERQEYVGSAQEAHDWYNLAKKGPMLFERHVASRYLNHESADNSEIMEELIKRGTADKEIASTLTLPHWQSHPKFYHFVESLIAKGFHLQRELEPLLKLCADTHPELLVAYAKTPGVLEYEFIYKVLGSIPPQRRHQLMNLIAKVTDKYDWQFQSSLAFDLRSLEHLKQGWLPEYTALLETLIVKQKGKINLPTEFLMEDLSADGKSHRYHTLSSVLNNLSHRPEVLNQFPGLVPLVFRSIDTPAITTSFRTNVLSLPIAKSHPEWVEPDRERFFRCEAILQGEDIP